MQTFFHMHQFWKIVQSAFTLALSKICQKTQRYRTNAYDSLENAYYSISCKEKCDRNVCELWFVEWALFRLQS